MEQNKNLKERIRAGEAVHGCWINMGSTVSAEIIGRAGFDWVLIDLEHGAGDDVVMYRQLQALSGSSSTPLVRTDEVSRPRVQHILDAGALGVMFPQLQRADEAEKAVQMMYYPPRGIRGLAKMVRTTGFGRNLAEYMSNVEKNLIGIVQIETINALKEIDAFAGKPGVDVLFVGPADLSNALGIFGKLDHPVYQKAITEVAKAGKKHGKATGVLLADIKEYEMYHQLGYRFIACGADGTFVSRGADEMAKQLRDRALANQR